MQEIEEKRKKKDKQIDEYVTNKKDKENEMESKI